MQVEIISCDACGTRVKVDVERAREARCARCKNPLYEAIEAQLMLSFAENVLGGKVVFTDDASELGEDDIVEFS